MTNVISTDDIPSNAATIAHHLIHGVNHLVQVTFVAEGKELIHYKHFELNQSSKTHHVFTASFSHDSLQTEETYQMEEAQHLVGKRLLVSLRYKNSKDRPERVFSGVITQVSFEQSHGNSGYLVIKGYSPTFLLDQAPHIQSFGGTNAISLQVIVSQILDENYTQNNKYKSQIQLSKTSAIAYSCQYNETAYNYLARMAEAYGEQFFYDGEILHFGKMPHQEKAIQLVYGRDVDQVEIQLNARHLNRQLYGYNSFSNKHLSATEETPSEIKGTLAQAAYAQSQKIFTSPSLQQAPLKAVTDQDIQNAQHSAVNKEGLQVFVTTGTTTVPFLFPGCLVTLNMLQPDKKTVQKEEKIVLLYIKKIIPKEGNNKNPDYCKYVYIDKSNQRHELCVLRFKTLNEVYLDNTKKIQVNTNKTVVMIDYIMAFKGYESTDGSLTVGFNRDNSKEGRRYAVDIDCFAALLGAMCDQNIDCISFNGASNFRGYPTPSSSHINGRVFDVGYIPKTGKMHQTQLTLADKNFDVERQKLFNEALYKYGFARDKKMLSDNFTYKGILDYVLPHCNILKNPSHNNHLHIQGYNRNESIIDEQRK